MGLENSLCSSRNFLDASLEVLMTRTESPEVGRNRIGGNSILIVIFKTLKVVD